MKCPYCQQDNDRVVDTRPGGDGFVVRRRRLCCECKKRFTTYERVETISITVHKKDGSRVPFDRDKIRAGLERACWKRPVTEEQISSVIEEIENEIEQIFSPVIESRFIGEIILRRLRNLDQVAYVRFASVFLHFENARDFANEVMFLLENQ